MSRIPRRHRPWSATDRETSARPRRPARRSLVWRARPPTRDKRPGQEIPVLHDVKVDRAVFLVEFIALYKEVALVKDGSGRQVADQRHVVLFVILDKSLRLDTFPLGEKGQYLQHIVAPAICALVCSSHQ